MDQLLKSYVSSIRDSLRSSLLSGYSHEIAGPKELQLSIYPKMSKPLDIDSEIKELIRIYSNCSSQEVLTRQQFQALLSDLYDTLETGKSLTKEELNIITDMVDISHDGSIDRIEIKKIAVLNTTDSTKQFQETK